MRHSIAICALMTALAACGVAAQDPPAEQKQAPDSASPPKTDDPGRPVLRHGGPSQKRTDSGPAKSEANIPKPIRDLPPEVRAPTSADNDEREPGEKGTAASAPRRLPSGDPLIEKARDAVFLFVDNLPVFICDQVTRRYEGHKIDPKWKYKDRFEVELYFTSGKEDYRNVRRNGKALKKGSPEDTGQWSSGEFGSILASLFSPNNNAKFKFKADTTAAGMPAKVYDYSVPQATANWTIKMGAPVKPSYSGAVWIEPQSGHVLRVELGTSSLPAGYPVDKVETVVDYSFVSIGGAKYLMPVKSDNLSCETGTFNCTKNEIEFKNYRKFSVESNILAVDSDISFPEEDVEKSKKPPEKYEPPQITVKPNDKKPQQ